MMRFGPTALHRICLIAILGLPGLYPAGPAYAGDEEINPSVYQVFDPETGFFIDVEPPPDAQPATTTHTPSAAPAATTAGTEPQTPAASTPVATTPPQSTSNTQTTGGLDPMVLAGGALIAVALAGLALRKRKGAD